MSQSNTGQAQVAETSTQETKTFIRQVRNKTRRKYAPEDKIRIVLEGFRREVTVSDLCRREGIKPGVFYAWTKEFMEAGKERLTRDAVRDATRQEIEHLKRENYDLKQLVADLSLEVHRFKKTAIPSGTSEWSCCSLLFQSGRKRQLNVGSLGVEILIGLLIRTLYKT